MTETRAAKKFGRVYVDPARPFRVPSFANSNYAIIFVDEYTKMKYIRFLQNMSDTAEGELHRRHCYSDRIEDRHHPH